MYRYPFLSRMKIGTLVMWGRKMKNKMIFTVLALMCLIGSIALVSAGQETRLNVYPNMELCMPSISGNIITFSELMGESTQMYDLSSGKQIGLSIDESGSGASISGNDIVWFQGDNKIMLYNTVTKRTTSLLSGYSPAIYGNIITYGWNSGIYTYDSSTKNTNLISVSGDSPQIYKKSIVYTDSGNVYIYDLSTKKQSLINICTSPGIYGDVVVWVNNGNIYMRNIATHKTIQITANGVSGDPTIYGNNIVFDTDLYSGNNYYNNI
jgi:Dipeptidyl peptidase IV (DPP IV) N-terminal region